MDLVLKNERGWYFWYPGNECMIGPYRREMECRQDCENVYATGRIAPDPPRRENKNLED